MQRSASEISESDPQPEQLTANTSSASTANISLRWENSHGSRERYQSLCQYSIGVVLFVVAVTIISLSSTSSASLVADIGYQRQQHDNRSQRCISDFLLSNRRTEASDTSYSILQHLHDVSFCKSTTNKNQSIEEGNEEESLLLSNPNHAWILLTETPSENVEDMMTIAAALLTHSYRMRVTMLCFACTKSMNSNVSAAEWIRGEVLARVPRCNGGTKALQVVQIQHCAGGTQSSGVSSCRANHLLSNRAIDMGAIIYQTLRDLFVDPDALHTRSLDVLLMGSSNLGGLLFAEATRIPVIVLGSQNDLQLAVEHHPKWQPSSKWSLPYSIYRVVKQRLHSLSLTTSIRKVQRLRKMLGFPRLKSPVECFRAVSVFLVDSIPKDSTVLSEEESENDSASSNSIKNDFTTWKIVERADVPIQIHHAPLMPPCIPCMKPQTELTQSVYAPLVMIIPSANVSAVWTRSLIQSLVLARQSVQLYDNCSWDTFSCNNTVVNFEVLWVIRSNLKDDPNIFNRFVPESLPVFIHTKSENDNLLEMVIRYPSTIVAMVDCEEETSAVAAANLGVVVVCLSQSYPLPTLNKISGFLLEQSTSNRRALTLPLYRLKLAQDGTVDLFDTATQVIHLLRRLTVSVTDRRILNQSPSTQESPKEPSSRIGSLEWIRAIVEALALVKRERQNSWKDVSLMQEDAMLAISTTLKSLSANVTLQEGKRLIMSNPTFLQTSNAAYPYNTITVLVAWFVLASAALYVQLKDIITIHLRRRLHHQHSYRNHHCHHRRNNNDKNLFLSAGDSISDNLWSRLSDLDDALQLLLKWYKDRRTALTRFDSNHDVDVSFSGSYVIGERGEELQTHHHDQGNVRKRRKLKYSSRQQ